jgi:hypothetical protein
MKFLAFIYNSVAKVSSSVSIGLLVSGIMVGTVACSNRENTATLRSDFEKSVSSSVTPEVEQVARENSHTSEVSLNSNLSDSPRVASADIPDDIPGQDVQPSVGQQESGRLRLKNNTPYASIVYIYASAEGSYRYAYIPACTTRELYDTYSASGLISLNGHTPSSIGQYAKREGNFLAIKMSDLDASRQEPLCEFNPSEALDVGIFDLAGKAVSKLGKGLGKSAPDVMAAIDNISSSGAKNFPDIENVAAQLDDALSSTLKRLRAGDAISTDLIKNRDQLIELLVAKHLSGGEPNINQWYLLSSIRQGIKSGDIASGEALEKYIKKLVGANSDETLEEYFRTLDSNSSQSPNPCAGLYGLQFLAKLASNTEQIYNIFANPKATEAINLERSNIKPTLVKLAASGISNDSVVEALEKHPECASTRNNNPVIIPISVYSPSRSQMVLQ